MSIRDVPGYEGLYSVSESGDVFSVEKTVPKVVNGKTYHRRVSARKLAFKKTDNGYLLVNLCKEGLSKKLRVHRIVMLAFSPVDGCEDLDVNHKDGNKENNSLQNLEWCTRSENHLHRYRVLKQKAYTEGRFGSLHHRAMAVEGLDENGNVVKRFAALMDAERDGFLASKICLCIQGKRKTHKNLKWRKAE